MTRFCFGGWFDGVAVWAVLPRRKHWLINIDEARKAFASMLHIEQELLFDGTCR